MRRVLLIVATALMCAVLQSCDEIGELFSMQEKITVTVHVDRGSLHANTLKVQSLVESVELTGDVCSLQVFNNEKPQVIAVTDEDNNLLMMYRGPVKDGSSITVNIESTTLALITYNPLFGPIPASDFTSLTNVIQSANQYADFLNSVNLAVNRGKDLTSTDNAQLLASLHNLLRELNEMAFSGQEALENAANNNNFLNCYPLIAEVNGASLTLRTSANSPSYYGYMTNSEGSVVGEISVPAASRYAFMDYFNGIPGQSSYGNPTAIEFPTEGAYTLTLSCTERSAILDFYIRLVNNVLAALGADLKSEKVNTIAPILRRAIEEMNINIESMSSTEAMRMIAKSYEVVVDYMEKEAMLVGDEANWELAGSLLNKMNDVYAEVHETTDAMLQTSWNFGAGNHSTIIIRVFYSPNYIAPLDDLDITIAGGNNQYGNAYTALANPLTVLVRNFSDGEFSIAQGRTVKFVADEGCGQMSQQLVSTGSNGEASTQWTLGGGTSGQLQSAYAVVLDATGNEVSNRVYFSAMVSNDRYRVSLCCDWADHTNYASQFDVDFTVANGSHGVVPLFPSSGRQWDYDGTSERYEMEGTFNTTTRATDMTVAMYLTYNNIHFRTDRYQFNLVGSGFPVEGQLIWDGFDHGQDVGAGCGTYIWLEQLNGTNNNPVKKATPKASEGKPGLVSNRMKSI